MTTPHRHAPAAASPTDPAGWGVPHTVLPVLIATFSAVSAINQAHFLRAFGGSASIGHIAGYISASSGNVSFAVLTGNAGPTGPTTRTATTGAIACPGGGTFSAALGAAVPMAAPTGWIGFSADNTTATFACTAAPGLGASAMGTGLSYTQGAAHPIPASPSPTVEVYRSFSLIGLA